MATPRVRLVVPALLAALFAAAQTGAPRPNDMPPADGWIDFVDVAGDEVVSPFGFRLPIASLLDGSGRSLLMERFRAKHGLLRRNGGAPEGNILRVRKSQMEWANGTETSLAGWKTRPMEYNKWIFHLYAEAVAAATALNAVADSKIKSNALEDRNRLDFNYIQRLHDVNLHQTAFLVVGEHTTSLAGGTDTGADADAPVQIDVPVFVLNLECRQDRKDHMLAILKGVGFSNVTVFKAISYEQLDWDSLVAEGRIDDSNESAFLPFSLAWTRRRKGVDTAIRFVGNAYSHFEIHLEAMRTQLPVYAIVEDDLLPASSHAEVNRRILAALDEWPADGDLLYLELCFESCQNPPSIAYSTHHPSLDSIYKSARPYCTAAVVYRQKAVPTILRTIGQAFASIDGMLSRLVREGVLNAYAATLLPFFQDSFYGSDVGGGGSGRRGPPRHGPSGIVCNEMEEMLVQDTELGFVAVVRSSDQGEVWTLPRQEVAPLLSFALVEGESAVYLTRSAANSRDFAVETMVCWGNESDECKWEMEVKRDSICFGAENVCEFKIVHRRLDGSERSYRRILLVQRMPLGQRPDWR